MPPKSESHGRPTLQTTTHIDISISLSHHHHHSGQYTVHGSSAYGKDLNLITLRGTYGAAAVRYFTISSQYHGRAPQRRPVYAFQASTLTKLLAFLRTDKSDGTTAAEQKSCLSIARMRAQFAIILASEYPICTFSYLHHTAFITWDLLYLPGRKVGLRRAPVFERARPRRLAMRWKRIHGSGQAVSIHSLRLASLIN